MQIIGSATILACIVPEIKQPLPKINFSKAQNNIQVLSKSSYFSSASSNSLYLFLPRTSISTYSIPTFANYEDQSTTDFYDYELLPLKHNTKEVRIHIISVSKSSPTTYLE